VSNKWLYRWRCFIQNNISLNSLFDNKHWVKSVEQSENPEIGILPPGPITNEQDFYIQTYSLDGHESQQTLREGLRVNIHYRAVNPKVWYILYHNYGGGPPVAREAIDVYSRDMAQHLKIYYGENRILTIPQLSSFVKVALTLQQPKIRKHPKN